MKNHFKKLLLMALMAVMAVGLIACGTDKSDNESTKEEKTSVTMTSLDSSKNEIELEVPYNPKRIAILDLASLDIIDELGVGDRVVGMASTSIDYLEKYSNDASIKNLGTIKEADLEAVMECEPDIIFIGGRLSKSYDALSEIAPVVYLATDTNEGLVNSVSKNAKTIASIFGMEDKVDSLMSDFGARIDAIKKISSGKTALVGMTTSGSFNLLAGSTSTHGNETSFETVVKQNPDYIFVMDRDSAISTAGAKNAKEIVENELVKTTDAYKNNHIIYLEHSNVWYTAEGGIQALDIMLTDLEKGLK